MSALEAPAFQSRPEAIAVIPAYNEASHIASLIREAQKYVDLVFVVDDGSTDGTGAIARSAGATVIRHDHNLGKGAAINQAFIMARELQPKAVVLLDGDGQHNPAEIPSLLEPVMGGRADMVVGSRFLKKNYIPKYRILGLTVLTLATNIGTGIRISDTQSGFRSFSQRAINNMAFREKGFAVESEMQFKVRQNNLQVAEVPIEAKYDAKEKRNPVVHGFGVLFRIVGLIISNLYPVTSSRRLGPHPLVLPAAQAKMDVIFVGSRGIPARYGGNETFVEEISKRLSKSGLKIGVVCEGNQFFTDEFDGITRIHTYSFQSQSITIPFVNDLISTVYLLLKYKNQSDIFFYVTPDGSLSGTIARLFGKKVIVSTDGVEWKRLLIRRHYAPFYLAPLYLITMAALYFAEYWACKISNATIADSQAIRKHLKRHSPKNSVYVTYGARGSLLSWMPKSKEEEILREFGVSSGKYYLTVGRAVPENNIHHEVNGFIESRSEKKLLLIGDYDNRSSYLRLIYRQRDINDKIILHNPVYDLNILGVLRKHCFGYIHAYEVGGTNPSLLEQMLFGKPIIAYDVPFNREVLQGGGIYFKKFADLSINIRKLENGEFNIELLKYKQMLRLEEQYNWEKVSRDYEMLFKKVSGSYSGARSREPRAGLIEQLIYRG